MLSFASSDENLPLSTSHSKSFQRFSKTWLGFGYQLPRFISCSVASWFMLLTRNSTPPPPPHPPKTPQCPCSKMDLKFQILDPSSQIHESRCTVVSLSVITNRPLKYCITASLEISSRLLVACNSQSALLTPPTLNLRTSSKIRSHIR